MGKLYDTLNNIEDGRKLCIKHLNDQNITTPEDANIHKIAGNIQLGVNGIDMWDTNTPLTDSNREIKNFITTIPLLDTSQVSNMSSMFYNSRSLITIPPLDTNKVTNMNNMFQNCAALTKVPPLDTSQVTNMRYICYNCKSLQEINLNKAPILPNCDMNDAFLGVPSNCLIRVYDEASKQKVLSSRSDLTNVVVEPYVGA